ncbi:unnamed protein product [Leuciscus chuanchicus]
MEFIKEEIEDMRDPEPSRIKHEDTEEQIDWMEMKLQKHELNEEEEEQQSIKANKLHSCTQCGNRHMDLRIFRYAQFLHPYGCNGLLLPFRYASVLHYTGIASVLRESGSTSDAHRCGIGQASCASSSRLHRSPSCALGSISYASVGRPPVDVSLY